MFNVMLLFIFFHNFYLILHNIQLQIVLLETLTRRVNHCTTRN